MTAHPGDESVGAASLLLRESPLVVVHVTDGAPRDGREARANGFGAWEGYAAAREAEAQAALAVAGFPRERRVTFGIAAGEAPLRLTEIARRLGDLFQQWSPRRVLTHGYDGGDPDRDAVSFAVHAAAALQWERPVPPPEIVEMIAGRREGGGGAFPSGRTPENPGAERVVRLSPAHRALKRAMLACFATQKREFSRLRIDEERFRPALHYDFAHPSWPGTLRHEPLPGVITGERFRDLVRYALLELGLRLAPAGI